MENNILTENKIQELINDSFQVRVFDTLPSTNTELKKMAQNGAPEGSILIARAQTKGRGRLGRSFYSPENSGIYMSILLRPDSSVYYPYITPIAAVAVCRALKSSGAENLGIKWVNDVFSGEKKVSGILTEVSFKKNSTEVDFLVVGIGINVSTANFPDELSDIAGSVFSETAVDKNKIAADVLDNLYGLYKSLPNRDFLDEYRNLSILKDRDVLLVSGDLQTPAKVLGIDDECRLIAELKNGEISHISTGEVSIRF